MGQEPLIAGENIFHRRCGVVGGSLQFLMLAGIGANSSACLLQWGLSIP